MRTPCPNVQEVGTDTGPKIRNLSQNQFCIKFLLLFKWFFLTQPCAMCGCVHVRDKEIYL